MAVGAKWTLGFVLHMNHAQFSSGLNRAAHGIRQLRQAGSLSYREAIERERNLRASVANTRAQMVRSAVSAAGLFTSMAAGKRIVEALTKSHNEFQYQGAALAAVLGEQAGAGEKLYQQFERLNPHIREFAPKEVVSRMKQLAQAGYDHNEVLHSMGAILDTVTASFGELTTEQGVELGINLHRAFGDAHNDMRQLLDVAVSAANKFPMTTSDIASAMGYATEAAVQFDQKLEDVLITIGMLMPVTKTASKAGTAYRNALLSLTKTKTVDFLEKHNVQVKDNNGEMRSALDIYEDLFKVLDKIEKTDPSKLKFERERMIHMLGGTRGGAMFTAYERLQTNAHGARGTPWEGRMFESRTAAVLAMRLGVMASADEARKLANELRETSQVIEQKFQASLDRASIALGAHFAPTVDRWRKLWTGVLDDLAGWMNESRKGGPGNFSGSLGNLAFMGMNVGSLVALFMGAVLSTGVVGRMLTSARGLVFKQMTSFVNPTNMAGAWHSVRNVQQMPSGRYMYEQKLGMMDSIRSQSLGTTLFQVAGVAATLVTTFYSLVQVVRETARELYDFGEKTAAAQRKRQEKFVSAEQMAFKFVSDKAEFKDIVRMKEGGFGPQVAFLLKRYQEGASPLQMYDEMISSERQFMLNQLKLERADQGVVNKRMAEFDEFAKLHRSVVEDHNADYIAKKFEKGDKVTKDQIWASFQGSMLDPRRQDSVRFKRYQDQSDFWALAGEMADAQSRVQNARNAQRDLLRDPNLDPRSNEAYRQAASRIVMAGGELERARMSAKFYASASSIDFSEIERAAADLAAGKQRPFLDPLKKPSYSAHVPNDADILNRPGESLPTVQRIAQEAQRQAAEEAKQRMETARLLQAAGTVVHDLGEAARAMKDGASGGMSIDPGTR